MSKPYHHENLHSSLDSLGVVDVRVIQRLPLLICRNRHAEELAQRLPAICRIELKQTVLRHSLTDPVVVAMVDLNAVFWCEDVDAVVKTLLTGLKGPEQRLEVEALPWHEETGVLDSSGGADGDGIVEGLSPRLG